MKKTVRVIAAAVIGTVCIFGAQSAAYAASAAKTDAAGVATATASANAAPAAAAKSTSALSDAADTNAPDLKFTPDGGGYYIYCNNNEFIRRRDLSDTSNPNPEYLMNNLNMTNGKYTLYFSHINHTELTKQENEADTADIKWNEFSEEETGNRWEVKECGFDIETDVEFRAKTDTKIRFTALGFEVQPTFNYYYTNTLIRYENPWGCLLAVSDYMQRPIYELGGVQKYTPSAFRPFELEIKAGETVWLSRYIDNYSVVPWMRPVHLLTDFEILYGCADINIAALKSSGIVGDRSSHSPNAAHGKYYRDRQYKGVADSLPSVTARLNYEIDDSTADGERLPVRVYNQYVPEGSETDTWITHINPQNDKNIKRISAESDILDMEYFDPSKKSLYGENVPAEDRNSIWLFDTRHSDTKYYEPGGGAADKADFAPNYELSTFKDNSKPSANLANYCVKTNYEVTVKNSGKNTRFFNYAAQTTAGIVVSVRDENGRYTDGHAVQKMYRDKQQEDTLASIELPPNAETKFTVEVFLPINYVGGIKNSFIITDKKANLEFPEDTRASCVIDRSYTGRDFVRTANGTLRVSDDGAEWRTVELSDDVKKIFDGNSDNYKIYYANGRYALMWDAFVPTPAYYTPYLRYKTEMYFLDEDFTLAKTVKFDAYPEDIRYTNGSWYVKTAEKTLVSEDLESWREWEHKEYNLPIECGNITLATKTGGETYLSPDGGKNFYRIAYRADVRPPRYIESLGELFFWAEDKYIYLSRDGVEWTRLECHEKIKSIAAVNGSFIINGGEKIVIPDVPVYTLAVIDGEVIQYDKQVQNTAAGIKVPLEMSMEKIGAEYKYDEKTKSVTVKYGKTELEMSVGSNRLLVNGKKTYMKSSVQYEHSRVFVPLDEVFAALGYDTEYFENAKTAVVSKTQPHTDKQSSAQ